MPAIKKIVNINGPPYRSISSPYRQMNQKAATMRKLSQGSPVVHDSSPTSLFKGTIKGWLYAKARVTWGGVASKRGDLWWRRMVDLC